MLAGCAGPLSTLEPAGPAAASIATLWWVMLAGSAIIFAIMLALGIWVYAAPQSAGRPAPRLWLVQGGLVFPSAVILVLLVFALLMGERLIPRPLGEPPLRVGAHAMQWHWEFHYPEAEGVAATPDRLHIPAGRPVDVVVTSADVIHSFWVPRLAGKIDAIPGHETVLRIEADRPGVYRGVCAEFCGDGHTEMTFTVEAHAEDDYEAALSGAGEGAAP
jgi:cytochrome c oxidase subunit II